MALVTVLRPQTEVELALALATLEAHGIETFVHGQYFGSLFPGLQIDSFNARGIMVAEEHVKDALEALAASAPGDEPDEPPPKLRFRDKLRVVLEAALFGWFIPGRRKRD